MTCTFVMHSHITHFKTKLYLIALKPLLNLIIYVILYAIASLAIYCVFYVESYNVTRCNSLMNEQVHGVLFPIVRLLNESEQYTRRIRTLSLVVPYLGISAHFFIYYK